MAAKRKNGRACRADGRRIGALVGAHCDSGQTQLACQSGRGDHMLDARFVAAELPERALDDDDGLQGGDGTARSKSSGRHVRLCHGVVSAWSGGDDAGGPVSTGAGGGAVHPVRVRRPGSTPSNFSAR